MRISDCSSDVCSSDLWILCLTDITRNAVRTRVTVRVTLRGEMVALDGTGEAFTNGRASDVNFLSCFENAFNGHNRTGRKFGGFGGVETEFFKDATGRSEENTSELQSLMRISYAVFCLKKKIR